MPQHKASAQTEKVLVIRDAFKRLHSFPTRRSSDLAAGRVAAALQHQVQLDAGRHAHDVGAAGHEQDRKSTRLNSSHVSISYAVFCSTKNISVRSLTH